MKGSYRKLVLTQCWRQVQIFRDHDVTEVLAEGDAPDRQPINVTHGHVARKLDFDVLTLVPAQHTQSSKSSKLHHDFHSPVPVRSLSCTS